MRIASQHVLTPEGKAVEATVTTQGERITEVSPGIAADAEVVEEWIVPGYVDTHCHGAAGANFADEDEDAVMAAVAHHRAMGTTTQFASTVTESLDDLVDQIARLRRLVAAGEIAGIHLEGPFLAESRKGAHNVELLRDPTPEALDRLIEAGGPDLRMVTLAPERRCGIEAVGTLSAAGVHAAFGHSEADATTARDSVDAGADIVTHLFNAMASIHHRKPGPVPWMLTDSRVMCELICDGVHLAPDVIRMAIRTAGPQRIGLVTDAMSATGQPDGDYMLGTLAVRVTDGRANLLNSDGTLGAIAGSTLTMGTAVEFLVSTVGVDLPTAAVMASTTPARWHGLDEVGQLTEGRRADMCLVGEDGHLVRVIRGGSEVDRSSLH